MTIQCCVCKKVKQDEHWVGKPLQSTLNVSHSYCPVCLEASKVALLMELTATGARQGAMA